MIGQSMSFLTVFQRKFVDLNPDWPIMRGATRPPEPFRFHHQWGGRRKTRLQSLIFTRMLSVRLVFVFLGLMLAWFPLWSSFLWSSFVCLWFSFACLWSSSLAFFYRAFAAASLRLYYAFAAPLPKISWSRGVRCVLVVGPAVLLFGIFRLLCCVFAASLPRLTLCDRGAKDLRVRWLASILLPPFGASGMGSSADF